MESRWTRVQVDGPSLDEPLDPCSRLETRMPVHRHFCLRYQAPTPQLLAVPCRLAAAFALFTRPTLLGCCCPPGPAFELRRIRKKKRSLARVLACSFFSHPSILCPLGPPSSPLSSPSSSSSSPHRPPFPAVSSHHLDFPATASPRPANPPVDATVRLPLVPDPTRPRRAPIQLCYPRDQQQQTITTTRQQQRLHTTSAALNCLPFKPPPPWRLRHQTLLPSRAPIPSTMRLTRPWHPTAPRRLHSSAHLLCPSGAHRHSVLAASCLH